MRTVALVLLVTCAVCVFAQHDHLEPPEYASPEDVKRAMGTSYHVVAEGEGSVYNPCYADPTSDECETYKLSPKPEPKRDTDFAEKLSTNVKQASSDAKDYSLIISNFEGKVNDWCCAVTGKPLYTVSGDRDVLNYMYYFLSQVFDYNGQNYAGRLVLAFHNNREADLGFNCDSVALGNGLMYSAPTDAFLGFREMFTAWLRKNEVNPKPVVNGFFPQARKLFSKFLRSRMLFANTTESTSEAAIAAVIPIVEKTDHLDYCEAGGEFSSIVQGETSIKFKATLDEMLRSCIDNGKLAKNPAEFGEVLLNSKREKEARELFATAVERGVLCNPWQRPDGLHRKDLPAVGIWPNYKLKGVVKAFKKLQPVVAAAAAKGALDVIGTRGDLTRTPLFSRQGVNQTLCAIANDDGCAEILRAAHTIMSSNDGYELACNGSLTIEIWRIAKNHATQREVGATNLVVQAVAPLNGVPLTLQVGEDSTQLDGQATEPVVFDDSFEHVLSVGSEGDGYFLHAQVCHPSMHDKMLDIPTNECAEFEDDDE